MSKFTRLLVLFLFPIFVVAIAFEMTLRNIPNDYAYKRAHLDAKSNDINVLFLGNSHIYFGIDPKYMSRKSFNEAHISQSLNYDLAILEKYRNNWKNLKYVVVPIDYFTMFSSLEHGVEKWREKNYKLYYDISMNSNLWNNFELTNGKLQKNLIRTKRYLFDNKSDITCDSLGFGFKYNSKHNKDLAETGEIAVKRHTIKIEDSSIFFKNVQTVKSLIAFSKQKNIKIIFITAPAYKTYTSKVNPHQLNTTIRFIETLTHKNPNAYYHNFFYDTSFIAEDFFDADHLNEIGAKKLTLKIDSIINKIENTNAQQ